MRHSIPLVGAIALLALAACESEPDPSTPAHLSGRVLDAGGDPVEGAVVALVFDVDTSAKLTITLRFHMVQPGSARIEVLGVEEEPVRLLYEGPLDAGPHSVDWDGTDDRGAPVPNGLYITRWETTIDGEAEVYFHELMLVSTDPADLAHRPNALTDTDGRFSIPLSRLPLGHELTATDPEGNSYPARISRTVQIHAFWAPGQTNTEIVQSLLIPENGTRVTLRFE